MALTGYTLTLFLHILFVFTWLATLPLGLLLKKIFREVIETDHELKMYSYRHINRKLSIIGGLGIVITGSILDGLNTSLDGFDMSSGNVWLVIKEFLWIIAFLGSAATMIPLYNKLDKLIEENAAIEDIRIVIAQLDKRGLMFTGLIIINIFLAITKPF